MLSLVSLLRYVSFDDCGYMGSVYEKDLCHQRKSAKKQEHGHLARQCIGGGKNVDPDTLVERIDL